MKSHPSPLHPFPLPTSSPRYGSLGGLITADRALALSGGPQRQARARACAGALRKCRTVLPPTPSQMNDVMNDTVSDEEGGEVYVVVACEVE